MGKGFSKASYFRDITKVEFTPQQKAAIGTQISSNPIMVYSKGYCPHCIRAKLLLDNLGVKYTSREINLEEDGVETQAILYSITSQKTVPNIFVAGKHVGGNSEVQALSRSGELQKMLDQAGIAHNS
jgi:glutaredoxin 3